MSNTYFALIIMRFRYGNLILKKLDCNLQKPEVRNRDLREVWKGQYQ